MLRAANEPLTGREIAKRVGKAQGVTDRATLTTIEASLHITLPKRESVTIGANPKR